MLGRMVQALGGAMTLANTYGIRDLDLSHLAERGRAIGGREYLRRTGRGRRAQSRRT
jgi:hypothetical protein